MINWKEIWKIHAPHYKNGYGFVPLPGKNPFRLIPGPGFGDLSHPTTNLVLDLMTPLVKDKVVIDIGCGSGILSIAASLLGAKAVYPFEIDPDSILHAEENFKLNDLKISLNKIPPAHDLVLINMISSEQKIALTQYPFLKQSPHTLISSGLLPQEKSSYLQEMQPWTPLESRQKLGWLALKLIFATY
jgi:ribosomal protein L11 methyltransferase